jgi:hypothetical protein
MNLETQKSRDVANSLHLAVMFDVHITYSN